MKLLIKFQANGLSDTQIKSSYLKILRRKLNRTEVHRKALLKYITLTNDI